MNTTSSVTSEGHTIRITTDAFPINYLSDIDANWHFTDVAGHRHYCEYASTDHWPTLRRVIDDTWWCSDCRDDHDDTHLECKICGEHIRPGMTGPGTKFISGRTSYFIDDEPVTKEKAQEFIYRLQR